MTKFSVVIPLYNKEKDVFDTIQSVLKQTYSIFEIIIIDDGSTDSSVEIVNRINDERIQVFLKNNEGVSIARNYGVEKATSSFIAFLDADDYWHPTHLENIFSLISKFPDYLWFATAYEKQRTTNLITPMDAPILKKGKNWSGEVDDFFKNSLIDCLAWTSSVCFKKDFFKSLNGFDALITHTEDIDLWIRAALKSPLVFSNKITARHHLNASNRSSKKQPQERKYTNFDKFIEEENKNPSLKKYIDLNRYSLAIIFKLHGEIDTFKKLINKVEIKNLNKKQRFLLKQNKTMLRFMVSFQKILENMGIRLSSF